jgi:PIN domain
MATNYILVDFENVQPDLSLLAGSAHKVKVFIGAKQQEGRISFKNAKAMVALGGNVELVEVLRSGRNAMDMHIAYYVGRLIEKEPSAEIHIISGDTDFDPLAEYLRANGVICKRVKTIVEILKKPEAAKQGRGRQRAAPPAAASTSRVSRAPQPVVRRPHSDKLAPIIKQLHSLSGKPATRKKLAQVIANYFRQHGGALPDTGIEQLIEELIRLKYVSQAGTKVNYHLT